MIFNNLLVLSLLISRHLTYHSRGIGFHIPFLKSSRVNVVTFVCTLLSIDVMRTNQIKYICCSDTGQHSTFKLQIFYMSLKDSTILCFTMHSHLVSIRLLNVFHLCLLKPTSKRQYEGEKKYSKSLSHLASKYQIVLVSCSMFGKSLT